MALTPNIYDFSPRAQEFVAGFIRDIDRHSGAGVPQSQLVQRVSRVNFDPTNSGVKGTILLAYIGGTVACEDKGQGLEPQPVHTTEAFFALHQIDYAQIRRAYPNTNFKWVSLPPPLDSGTMDELSRVGEIDFGGREAQKIILSGENLLAIGEIHGTDSALKTLSRRSEVFSCSPIPTVMITAQDPPGPIRGDGRKNILDALALMHAGIAGDFAVCADQVFIPFDSNKISDHDHMIYGAAEYGYGHFGTLDSSGLTVHKGIIRKRTLDTVFMPWHDERFIHHYGSIDTRATSFENASDGTCFEIPTNALRSVVYKAMREVKKGEASYRYVIVGSQGASNINDARKEFLSLASEAGICSIVVSEVKGATDVSPYAAGARSSTHVTVVSPDTVFNHTMGKFYVSAAWSEYVMEKYNLSEADKGEVRPLLFREMYQRQRGYGDPFIPGAENSRGRIRDFALQMWRRSLETQPLVRGDQPLGHVPPTHLINPSYP